MTPTPPGARRLDVLLVAPPLQYSGPTLYALTLATGLAGRGLRVQLLSAGGRFEDLFRARGIPLAVEPALERPVLDWLLFRRLGPELRDAGLRAVHAVSSFKAAAAAAIARGLRVPAIVTIHRPYNPRTAVSTDWAGVSSIITLSETLRADVVNNRRAPKDLVRVIPSGVSPPEGSPPPFERSGAVPIVGTLGDVEKTEAQADFLRAAAEVMKRVPKVEFLVVSGGAEPRELRRLARDLGVAPATTFTTYIDTAKAVGLMDICVLPGAQEGPGQTILEAMAAGRPVITVGSGAAFDVIQDEVTGLLVDKGDPSKLAAAILRLVEDRALAARIGASARDFALERFPLDRMLDETLAAYDSALAARSV